MLAGINVIVRCMCSMSLLKQSLKGNFYSVDFRLTFPIKKVIDGKKILLSNNEPSEVFVKS